LLPPQTIEESIETYKLHSISNTSCPTASLSSTPPFRSPHHSVSYAGMAGGGTKPKPGEISLAHHGILFLDELPEFSRQVLESLRQPLESHEVTISRVNFSVTYPAKFLFISAMNPCPCGYYQDIQKACACTPSSIKRYWKKVSGPILDRIDIIIDVPRLLQTDYTSHLPPLSSETMQKDIQVANNFQTKRQQQHYNGRLSPHQLKKYCLLNKECQSFLGDHVEQGLLTGRSHDKVVKVARTIADFEQSKTIQLHHILEAIQFRQSSWDI